MKTIRAVYEGGVFRPKAAVDLPDRTEVEFEPRAVQNGSPEIESYDDVFDILDRRFESGEHDVAARHNEHQP